MGKSLSSLTSVPITIAYSFGFMSIDLGNKIGGFFLFVIHDFFAVSSTRGQSAFNRWQYTEKYWLEKSLLDKTKCSSLDTHWIFSLGISNPTSDAFLFDNKQDAPL